MSQSAVAPIRSTKPPAKCHQGSAGLVFLTKHPSAALEQRRLLPLANAELLLCFVQLWVELTPAHEPANQTFMSLAPSRPGPGAECRFLQREEDVLFAGRLLPTLTCEPGIEWAAHLLGNKIR